MVNLFIFTVVVLLAFYIFNVNRSEDIEGKIRVEIDKSKGNNTDSIGKDKETFTENINSEYLRLINKCNKISSEYEPDDLVIPSIRFGNNGDMMVQYMRSDAAMALEQLFKAAKSDGITLIAISGYRSYEYQISVYNNEVSNVGEIEANRFVAKPGESEHQLGLAMDILSDEYMVLDEEFEDTDAFRWLRDNMSKFGFILRFPKGKESITGYGYEPWHLRYVGVEVATEIMSKGITLEEFLD